MHVDGSVNPIRDKETIDMELQIKDLETLDNFKQKNIKISQSEISCFKKHSNC